jgi:GlcNAc-PI de-N-acetylase
MRIRLLLLVLLLCWCESGAGRVRAVRAWVPRPAKILVVTAHPDDEILLAPFLAAHCIDRGASCAILVLTRGEGGGDPEVRTGEMARAAALLNLRLLQWSYPDLMEPWPERETLVRQIGDVIASERPDMILTFDPAHGTTGHPAHRETGAIVRDTGAANVWFLETLARFEGQSFVLSSAECGDGLKPVPTSSARGPSAATGATPSATRRTTPASSRPRRWRAWPRCRRSSGACGCASQRCQTRSGCAAKSSASSGEYVTHPSGDS